MKQTNKTIALTTNIAFLISYVYFIVFYLQGTFIQLPLPSKLKHFLFESETGMMPLAVFSLCLIVIAVVSFTLYSMKFSKATSVLCGLGFVPTLSPILCNLYFGPFVNEKSDVLWLTIAVILSIYLIAFQTLFIRDYKRIDK
ncbi:MAG: hypothetical protein IJB93_03570 [Clostridia bacterium]|nr:hypothetical protein [Clostridia bacterium]MBQ4267250.1 hypothetical protein [Clostridia bacterium]